MSTTQSLERTDGLLFRRRCHGHCRPVGTGTTFGQWTQHRRHGTIHDDLFRASGVRRWRFEPRSCRALSPRPPAREFTQWTQLTGDVQNATTTTTEREWLTMRHLFAGVVRSFLFVERRELNGGLSFCLSALHMRPRLARMTHAFGLRNDVSEVHTHI